MESFYQLVLHFLVAKLRSDNWEVVTHVVGGQNEDDGYVQCVCGGSGVRWLRVSRCRLVESRER